MPGWITKHTGGSELQAFLLTQKLVDNNYDVSVISYNSANNFLNKEYYNIHINYHFIKSSKVQLIRLFRIFLELTRIKPDICYVRTKDMYMLGIATAFKKLFKWKVIYAIAGNDELEITHLLTGYKFNNLKQILRYPDFLLANFFVRNAVFRADRIITQSYDQQRILLERYGLRAEVIRNSVPDGDTYTELQKENIILWVGNLRKEKKPEVFFSLVEELRLPGWKYVMIGRPGQYEKNIHSVSNPDFIFLGELDFRSTSEYISKAKILVNTSPSEGFPNTFIEAWLRKTLVVSLTFDVEEIMKNRKIGFVCDGLYNQLKQTVEMITNSHSMSNEIIENAYLFASAEFNLEKNSLKFINSILKLFNSNTENSYIH